MISTALSPGPFIHFYPSVILLMIPSSAFFIYFLLYCSSLFVYSYFSEVFVKHFLHFLNLTSIFFPRSWVTFTVIILNSFSNKLPKITPCSSFWVYSWSSIWDILLSCFSLSNFLWVWFPFHRIQECCSCFCSNLCFVFYNSFHCFLHGDPLLVQGLNTYSFVFTKFMKGFICTFKWHSQYFCYCSVSKSCSALYHHMDCNTSGSIVLYCLTEFAQTHVHWFSDAV